MSWNHATQSKYLWKPVTISNEPGGGAYAPATLSFWHKKASYDSVRAYGGLTYSTDLSTPTGQNVSMLGARNGTLSGGNAKGIGRCVSGIVQTNDTGTDPGFSLIGGQWNHICVVRSSANLLSLYVNGALVHTNAIGTRVWKDAGAANIPPNLLTLGQDYAGLSTNAALGYFAEVAVWDAALDATAVGHLCTGTGTGKAANHADVGTAPVLYAPMTSSSQLVLTVGTGSLVEGGGTESWDADHPTITAAAGGTARGAPFGNRSTAFNGGRLFTGPIN
jgi:hypothetical protein